jgi:hypothetical protein
VAVAVPFPDPLQFVLFADVHVTVGTVGLATVALQVAVHPDVVLVTVTVYVPPDNPLIEELVEPVFHRYVTPDEVAVAVPFPAPLQSVLFADVHVTVGTIGLVIVVLQVAVHPDEVRVTVTV